MRDDAGLVMTVDSSRADQFVVVQRRVVEKVESLLDEIKSEVMSNFGRPGNADLIALRPSEEDVRKWSGVRLSDDEFRVMQRAVLARYEKYLNANVYPAIVEKSWEVVEKGVRKLVAAKAYARAREVLWQAPLSARLTVGEPSVAVELRRRAVELANAVVNVTQWQEIEPTLTARREELVQTRDVESWRKWCAEFPRVVTASAKGAGDLLRVEKRLRALDVASVDIDGLVSRTLEWARAAEGAFDEEDRSVASDGDRPEDGACPSMKEFSSRDAEYRAYVSGLGVLPPEIDRLIAEFSEEVGNLVRPSERLADEASGFRLGAKAMNARIGALGESGAQQVEETLAAEKLEETKSQFRAQVSDLVAARKFAEAEALLNGLGESEADGANVALQTLGSELRATVLEPAVREAHAERIAAFVTPFASAVRKASFDEARRLVWTADLSGVVGDPLARQALRSALLDEVVNPRQYAQTQAQLEAQSVAMFEAEEYEAFLASVESCPYLREPGGPLLALLEDLKSVSAGRTVGERSADECLAELTSEVRALTDANGLETLPYRPKDGTMGLAEVGRRVEEVTKALLPPVAEHAAVAEILGKVREALADEAAVSSMTATEANAGLDRMLQGLLAEVEPRKAARDKARNEAAKAKALADFNEVVPFDTQIDLAKAAIAAHRDGAAVSAGKIGANGLLGEYIRVLRLLKLKRPLADGNATALLLGGVCLEQPEVVERALALGADVNGTVIYDAYRRTSPLLAAQVGRLDLLERLKAVGADFGLTDAVGNTILHCAAQGGNADVVRLVSSQEGFSAKNATGETPLFSAVRRSNMAIIQLMSEAGVDLSPTNPENENLFNVACAFGNAEVLDRLESAGWVPGVPQLILAVKRDRLDAVKWLVARGVDVNAPGVMAAAKAGSAVREYLVGEGGIVSEPETGND